MTTEKEIRKEIRKFIEKNIIIYLPKHSSEQPNKKATPEKRIHQRIMSFLPIYNKIRELDTYYIDQFKNLKIINIEKYSAPKNKVYQNVYYTQFYENHPIVVQLEVTSNKSYHVYFIKPIGPYEGQSRIINIKKIITFLYPKELLGLFQSIGRSMAIRRYKTVEDPRYYLLKCSEIKRCAAKMKEISNMRISKTEKDKLKKVFKTKYQIKAAKILKKFFDFIDNSEFKNAKSLLGIGKSMQNQVRLDTMFYRDVLGHLKIFISLKELLNLILEQLDN